MSAGDQYSGSLGFHDSGFMANQLMDFVARILKTGEPG
jgi:hypothetical protein